MFRVTMIYIYIYINYLFCIVIYSFPCPLMYNYVYIYKLVPMIWNIYLLFVLSFVCFHVDHDTTNASLYLCLFPHIHAPVYVLKCWYSCYIFLSHLELNISVIFVNIMHYYFSILCCTYLFVFPLVCVFVHCFYFYLMPVLLTLYIFLFTYFSFFFFYLLILSFFIFLFLFHFNLFIYLSIYY